MISQVDLAYCAGLIDGEGSISAPVSGRGKNHRYRRIAIAVLMCDHEALDVLAATLGGRVIETRRRTSTGKTIYVWALTCRAAAEAIKLLLPYLRIKLKRAKLAIELQSLSRHHGQTRKPFTTEELLARDTLVMAILSENRKGPTSPEYPRG